MATSTTFRWSASTATCAYAKSTKARRTFRRSSSSARYEGRRARLLGRGRAEPMKYDAVLFDCDGVLVDSEPITNGVLRDMLEELGWTLTPAECMRLFVGKAVKDEHALIEAQTGQRLTEEWMVRFRERRNEGLMRGVQAVSGAVDAVARIHAALDGRIACASGADRF